MSRTAAVLEELHRQGRAGIVAYVTAGYPELDATVSVVKALVQGGADIIELGVAFSDPLADGTTIQRSSHQALLNGATLDTCLQATTELRGSGVTAPVLLMGYYNPFLSYGLGRLCGESAAAGVDGFIVPDLPVEESDDFRTACRENDLDLVFLLAPTSTDERIETVARASSGFVYCVSLTGVTGARGQLSGSLPEFLSRVRAKTTLPLMVGFGISTPDHVSSVARMADGAVIGSAIIDLIDRLPSEQRAAGLVEYIGTLRR